MLSWSPDNVLLCNLLGLPIFIAMTGFDCRRSHQFPPLFTLSRSVSLPEPSSTILSDVQGA